MAWDNNRTNFDRNLAVVIGIDRYDSRGIHDLQTAVSDANAIANLLQDEYGYKDEHIIRLFSPKNDEATLKALNQPYHPATLAELRLLLTETLPNQLKPTPADRLLFYFAGHGIPRNSKDGPAGYLVPQTAEQGNPESFLSMRELHDALSKLECHHLLVILDCCFAGTFRWASSRKLMPILEKVHKEHYDRFIRYPAWQVITSAAHDQQALDLSIDQRGSAIEDTKHSPFALALIEGLQDNKADIIQDQVITAHELYLYLDRRVNELSREMQTPGIYPMRLEYDRGEYIFTRPGFKRDDLTKAPPLNEENNPYRGLKPFEERHSRFFFGRKSLVETLSHRLTQSRRPLTVVIGASGSGKSSLVKAGLLPHLREKQEQEQPAQRWYILDPIRPGKSPFTELARAFLPVANSKLITQLAQVSFLDKTFAEVLDPNSKQKQKAASPNPTQFDIRERRLGDEAFDDTKLAERWNNAEPEAKLLLILDYYVQLQGFCHQSQEQEQLSSLYFAIEQTLNRLTQAFQQEPQSFTHLIATWSQFNPGIKLLLVIDQFEELITMSQGDRRSGEQSNSQEQDDHKEWQRFLSLLRIALTKYRRQLHIVLTLRSDFEPRFLNSALKAHWKSARFPVRAMNSDELRDAIEGPALKQALYFEPPELVGKLIDEVGQMPGVLPLLSFTLSELYIKLYERWAQDNSTDRALRIKDYEELGGVAGALTRRATQEYDNLVRDFGEASGKAYQATMRRVMLRMVTIEGGGVARRRVPESELVYPDGEENKRIAQVIERLVKARLLVKGQETGEPYVEPAHDFLVRGWNNLQDWIGKEQEYLTLQQRLTPAANDWRNTGQPENYLWNTNPRLDLLQEAINLPENNWLNQLEREFVKCSIRKRDEEFIESEKQNISTISRAAKALLASDQQLEALVEAVKAGKKLQQLQQEYSFWKDPELYTQVQGTLQQLVYEIRERDRCDIDLNTACKVSFSRDLQRIASPSGNSIKIWSRNGKLLQTFEAHSDEVTGISFSPDGQSIASASRDGTIKIWNFDGKDGKLQKTLPHGALVYSVTFSPDGQTIASSGISVAGSGIEVIKLWSCNGTLLKTLQDQDGVAQEISFSSDGQIIASSGSGIYGLKLWSCNGILLQTLSIDQTGDSVAAISFSPNHQIIATAACSEVGTSDLPGVVKLWSRDGILLETLEGHTGGVLDVSFSPDSQTIASASADGTIKVWRCDGTLLETFKGHHNWVRSVRFSSDGQTLVSSSEDGTIRFWSLARLPFTVLKGKGWEKVVFSPDSQTIVASSGTVWSRDGTLLEVKFPSCSDLMFSPDGQILACGQCSISFSSDSQTIASVGTSSIKLWSNDGVLIKDFLEPKNETDNNNILRLWSRDGVQIETWQIPGEYIYDLSFSPDGQIIASTSSDEYIRLWSRDGREIKSWNIPGGRSEELSFSPDGQMIASAQSDGTVRLWNYDGQLLKTLPGHFGYVNSVSFSPDSQIIASGGGRTVKLWHINGTLLNTFNHKASVLSVSFSPDGKIVASGSRDGTDDMGSDTSRYSTVILWNLLDLNDLLRYGCNWLCDYLKNHPNIAGNERQLCHGISSLSLSLK